ncbi:DNA excision repair protein ERCC-6 [Phytophthora pseudosyringae]|uniref:DNA excision repair protein ERCC-6 n=1 Tax=Phytophthora pseudosyringae TaxID=221518 RepID=A0A8T1VFW9_9STRA|nr:DNA excision repair protein ERCC-6 [Phytophthora pseudosyringae]
MSLTIVAVPGALQHVAPHISSFLGPPSCLALSQACGFGSTKLLDWIWDSSCTAGNLPILQVLLANDSGQEGRNTNSNKKRKVQAGGEGVKAEKLEPSQTVGGHVVHWSENVMMSALNAGHADAVRWLHEHMPDQNNKRDIEREIRYSLIKGDNAIAKILMSKGRCVLDCGYIQRDISLANSAIQDLAHLGRLDMMQQVVLLHSPRCDDSPLCLHAWSDAIRTACENGYLAMLQWLFDHPLGQELRQNMKPHRKYSFLVCLAARTDKTEITQYLYEQGGVDEVDDEAVIRGYAREFMIAIRFDRYHCVKWMAENIPFPERGLPGARAIDIATRSRRFNILKLFLVLDSSGVIDQSENEENRGDQMPSSPLESVTFVLRHQPGSGALQQVSATISSFLGPAPNLSLSQAFSFGSMKLLVHCQRD